MKAFASVKVWAFKEQILEKEILQVLVIEDIVRVQCSMEHSSSLRKITLNSMYGLEEAGPYLPLKEVMFEL